MTPAAEVRGSVPVVRGLEWQGDRAETLLGRYLVGRDHWSADELYEMRGPDCGDNDAFATADRLPTIEAAKAWAQEDYEQRILSAIDPDFLAALTAAQERIAELEETLKQFTGAGIEESIFNPITRTMVTAARAILSKDPGASDDR